MRQPKQAKIKAKPLDLGEQSSYFPYFLPFIVVPLSCGAPQEVQNLAPGGISFPHCLQYIISILQLG